MKNIVAATLRLITIGLLLMLVGLAMISTAAAQLETFLVRASDGSYYQYHSEALNRAYLRAQINPDAVAGTQMYRHFEGLLTAGGTVVGLKDSDRGYFDYKAICAAHISAQLAQQDFDVNAYFGCEDAKKLAAPVTGLKQVDDQGQVSEIPDPVVEPQHYDAAGTYGPASGSETIATDVVVGADGVILQNLLIQGDLTISEAVGDGTVTLNKVTVAGDTFVRGGGANSIHLNGGQYSRIIMEKTASAAVRIVATGVDGLEVVIAEDAAGETIILDGAFDSITINAPNMTITTQGATTTIGTMTVGAAGGGTTLNLVDGTRVAALELNAKTAVKGQGTVVKAEVKADGVVFDRQPGSYTVAPGLVVAPVFPSPGGGGYNPPEPVAVTGVSLNQAAFDLQLADQAKLTATVAPNNATNPAVSWKTSNSAAVAVAGDGTLTAMAKGTAVITVTTSDGAKTASCIVTVIDKLFEITGDGTITAYLVNENTVRIPERINGITVTAIGSNAFKSKIFSDITLPLSLTAIADKAFTDCLLLNQVNCGPAAISVADGAFSNCPQLRTLMYYGNAPQALNKTAFPLLTTIKYYQGATGFGGAIFNGYTRVACDPSFVSNFIAVNTDLSWQSVDNFNQTASFIVTNSVDLSKIVFSYFLASPGIAVTCGDQPLVPGVTALDFRSGPLTFTLTPLTGNGAPINYQITAIKDLAGTVSLNGQALEGQTLTVNTSALVKPAWLPPNYQWQRETASPDNYVDIAGATAATYQLTADDANKKIRVRLTLPVIGSAAVESPAVTVMPLFETIAVAGGVAITKYNGGTEPLVIPAVINSQPVVAIAEGAFARTMEQLSSGQTGPRSVALPATIKSIGKQAFQGCRGMTTLTFAGSSELTTIGDQAFQGCQALTSVSLPASVKTIGAYGFLQCMAMTSLDLGSVETIDEKAFSQCNSLASLTIPNAVKVIDSSVFADCTGLKTVTFAGGENAQTLNAWVFSGCTALETVTFAADSKAVFNAWGLFNGCSKLNKVTLPPGLTKIPGYAFQNCTVLTSLTIPATVTTIEVSAFNSCLANLVLRFDGNAPTRGNDAIPAGTTIAYWDGKTGFTEPAWPGYSLKLRNISLTQTNVTINSASFSFAPQTGATAVLQQKADGGDWELAATAPLDENSAAVTATGLVPGKSYDFRLQISGGDNAGPSTVVSLTTKVAVTGISLDKVSMELLQNNSETITASVEPGDAAQQRPHLDVQ